MSVMTLCAAAWSSQNPSANVLGLERVNAHLELLRPDYDDGVAHACL